MEAAPPVELSPPRKENCEPMLIAGLSEHFTEADNRGMPMQWQLFSPYIGNINGQVGQAAYGVLSGFGGNVNGINYLTGVEISGTSQLPDEFSQIRIPGGDYSVFEHGGHVSTIQRTWQAIWQQWIPQSGLKLPESAVLFEKYGEEFDPESGLGVVEIWIPQKPA